MFSSDSLNIDSWESGLRYITPRIMFLFFLNILLLTSINTDSANFKSFLTLYDIFSLIYRLQPPPVLLDLISKTWL